LRGIVIEESTEREVSNMTQGERVLEIRKVLGLTMDKFGEKLGVQKSAISKIEKDKVNLSDQMVKLICREYNVNYDWLMDEDGEMFSDLPQTVLDELCSQYELDDLDRFIVELYVGLPKDVRDGIKARAKDLIQKREVSEGGKNIE
jgi:transcriptional regulator with XRE-family HTH domain